ncbi:MAG TPA: amidohydrolase [Chloroflexota bacterium]|nr:amidohydrolase [Chloroflexota bacterium]
MDQPPLLFVNCHVLTMDPTNPRAEAILTDGEMIAAVGSRADVENAAWGARVVDLHEQTVVPGFNDSHMHILSAGLEMESLVLRPEQVTTIADIERLVSQRAEQTAVDAWITGSRYDHNRLRERRHPTREELDHASGGRPVVLWHTSGHVLVANSKALQLAGITAVTEAPAGGEIERDAHGEPTGLLKESPAMDLVGDLIPPPTVGQGTEAILRAMAMMVQQGVTSASDAATPRDDNLDDELTMYRRALDSGRLLGRITLMPQIGFVAPPASNQTRRPDEFDAGNRPDWLRIGATKIFADGALSTGTAAVRRPYAGTDDHGIFIWDRDTLHSMVGRAHRAGWQVATHALGDAAIELILDAYQAALAVDPRPDHRHRIEHCMLADEGLVRRIKDLGVVPDLQPDISQLGDSYITALCMERASEVIPMALFRQHNVRVAFSSDRPVIPGDPLECVLDAMARRTPQGIELGPQHRVSPLEAIRNYTAGGAYAGRMDDRLGTITPGRLADLAVLSQDPTVTDPDEFSEVEVTMTVLGGRIVYGE